MTKAVVIKTENGLPVMEMPFDDIEAAKAFLKEFREDFDDGDISDENENGFSFFNGYGEISSYFIVECRNG